MNGHEAKISFQSVQQGLVLIVKTSPFICLKIYFFLKLIANKSSISYT